MFTVAHPESNRGFAFLRQICRDRVVSCRAHWRSINAFPETALARITRSRKIPNATGALVIPYNKKPFQAQPVTLSLRGLLPRRLLADAAGFKNRRHMAGNELDRVAILRMQGIEIAAYIPLKASCDHLFIRQSQKSGL